jgi:hypothetical protein
MSIPEIAHMLAPYGPIQFRSRYSFVQMKSVRIGSSPMIRSPACRAADSMIGLPGQFVASPTPVCPVSVMILSIVQLYLTPSTSQTFTSPIFIVGRGRLFARGPPRGFHLSGVAGSPAAPVRARNSPPACGCSASASSSIPIRAVVIQS